MKEWHKSKIISLLRESAEIAMHYYGSPEKELKSDMSIVTIADREIEEHLTAALDDPGNGSFLIGEETIGKHDESYIQRGLTDIAWIVDPIDGTAPYANHVPTWGISICMAVNGILSEGAMYLPASREVYVTEGDEVFYATELEKEWTEKDLCPLKRLDYHFDETGLISLSQHISKRGRFLGSNPVHSVCSCVYSLAQVLLGNYAGYLGTVKLWDLAAGWVMLSRCGMVAQLYSSRKKLDLTVCSEYYRLSSDDPNRWHANDHIIFANSSEIVEYLTNSLEFHDDDT